MRSLDERNLALKQIKDFRSYFQGQRLREEDEIVYLKDLPYTELLEQYEEDAISLATLLMADNKDNSISIDIEKKQKSLFFRHEEISRRLAKRIDVEIKENEK